MTQTLKGATLAVLAYLISGASQPSKIEPDADRVSKIVERSKITPTIYSLYGWNVITIPGQEPVEEWSAEFNSGPMHRVETPRDRVIANCQALTGTALSLTTGQLISGPSVAKSACGIDTGKAILSSNVISKVSSRFGSADRIQLTDSDYVRTYDISDDGIIIRCVYALNDPAKTVVLKLEAQQVDRASINADIFSEQSLSKSAVPEKYKVAL